MSCVKISCSYAHQTCKKFSLGHFSCKCTCLQLPCEECTGGKRKSSQIELDMCVHLNCPSYLTTWTYCASIVSFHLNKLTLSSSIVVCKPVWYSRFALMDMWSLLLFLAKHFFSFHTFLRSIHSLYPFLSLFPFSDCENFIFIFFPFHLTRCFLGEK